MKAITLKNGFEYILVNTNSKLCCIEFKLNIGSKDDPISKKGIAHFVEHMLYDNNIDNILDDLGVNWNAYTNRDSTGYTFICKKSKVNKLLKIVKTMMFNMKFTKPFYKKEKKVVIEEILLRNSQRHRRLTNLVYKNLFNSKYQNEIKGSAKTVNNIQFDDLISFYKKWYIPANIKFVCLGNFNSTKVTNFLNKLDKIHNSNTIYPYKFSKFDITNQFKLVDKTFDSNLINISCTAIIPGNSIHNNSIFDIISLNLQTSLDASLREKYGLSYNPHCNYVIYKDFGILELSATVKATNLKKSLKMVHKVLKQTVYKSKLKTLRENATLTNHLLYENIESQCRFYCDELLKSDKTIHSIHDYHKKLQNITISDINTEFKKLKFLTVMN